MPTADYSMKRSPVVANNIVATSQPLAAQAGLNALKNGGNAMDAALTAAICLTVVEPTGNGVGSDAFSIIWDGEHLHGLNASGKSAKAWSPERFANLKSMPDTGWETVTVPGAVSSWVTLSEKFGKLPFEELFKPAVNYARNGFLVSPIISDLWSRGAEKLKDVPGFADNFMPNGKTPKVGELYKNEGLAKTLELIASTKGKAFYEGELAEKITQFAKEYGAALTMEDFAEHENEWCGTIEQSYGDISLHEIPPNGQGIAALMALGMLQHHDLKSLDPDSAEAWHIQIEAIKVAFQDLHAYVADPNYMTEVAAADLLNPDYLKARSKLIDPTLAKQYEAGAPKHGGTVYITACDENDMMVSLIQSNYAGFGSGVVVPGTGISLQNRGLGFTLESGHQNEVGPSKRPFQTIIPGFMMKGKEPLMSFGVMGGPIQAQGHVQMTLRTQLWGQDPQTAIDAPRWRFTSGKKVAVETACDSSVIEGLKSMGHDIELESPDSSFGFGGAQLIQRLRKGSYIAGSDFRRDGQAVGY